MRTATPSFSFWLLLLALVLPAGQRCQAQATPPADSLSAQFRRYNRLALTEQLFVHLDRPAYVAGETIWLKVYAVDGTHHRPLTLSKVAYVELLDATQRPVSQVKLALNEAMGHGTLELPTSLASGRYVVRAYTNWMKNAGPDYYFQAPITVVNTWQGGPAPAATAAPDYDLQFFPEGGQLVRGLPGRLGFKLTDQQGRSVAATGTVTDAKGTTVATFQTLKFGMGSFAFTPTETGTAYTATVRLPNGQTTTARLPAAAGQGYTLQVADAGPTAADLTLTVQAQGQPGTSVQLLAHTGQQVTVSATAALVNGQATFPVAKRALLPGITHFTVFSETRPVAERLYFRRPSRALTVRGQAGAATYGPRAPARVQLTAAQPAALSLAVYRLDSLSSTNPTDIGSYLQLSADIKGFIEDAGYYFRDSSATAQLAADNLMLTQGWQRFQWETVLRGPRPVPAYQPELNGYVLQARVSDPTQGQPAANAVAYLSLLGRQFQFANSRSRADGVVQFEMPYFYGLRKLVLQLDPTRDSTHQLALLSPFTVGGAATAPALPPLAARLAASLTERHVQVQPQRAFPGLVRYQPVPGDTLAFYGRPSAHYRLDDYTRFPSLEEVLREYVPGVLLRKRKDGFHFLVVDRPNHTILQDNPLTLLDGLPVFNLNQLMALDPKRINQLDVVASRYFLGQQLYDGLVSFGSYQGDLGGFALNPRALIEEYEGLQVPREFYTPRYHLPAQQRSRLPDLRNLLYWNPDVRLTAGQPQSLNFFTSDQAGRYLVVAQGLTTGGLLGSTSFTFEVKPAL